jgi:hypothetical protein
MALASLVPFQGPKMPRFLGPTPSNAPRNNVAPLKTITYRAIKTTGTFIVIFIFMIVPSTFIDKIGYQAVDCQMSYKALFMSLYRDGLFSHEEETPILSSFVISVTS